MHRNTVNDYGRVAFEAYSKATGGVSLASGERLRGWDALPIEVRNAWGEAARQVARRVQQRITNAIGIDMAAFHDAHRDGSDRNLPDPDAMHSRIAAAGLSRERDEDTAARLAGRSWR